MGSTSSLGEGGCAPISSRRLDTTTISPPPAVKSSALRLSGGLFFGDAHAVEGAVNEDEGDDKEENANAGLGALIFHGDGDLGGQKAKEGGELDDGVHGDGGGVLEGIAHGVAHHGGGMEFGAFLAEIHFHDLLGVVPGAAGIGHEDGLKEAKKGDADEVADEEVRIEEGQRQRKAENDDEDVPHPFLGIDGADADDFL